MSRMGEEERREEEWESFRPFRPADVKLILEHPELFLIDVPRKRRRKKKRKEEGEER